MADVKILNGYNIKDEVARTTKQDIIQYSTMPAASAEYENKVVQYIGSPTRQYQTGCFYKCYHSVIPQYDIDTYIWSYVDTVEFTPATIVPTTTNFVTGTRYSARTAFQKTADLFGGLQGEIDTVNGLIPNQATSQNQLADKAFVNTTVATNTANFRGNWASWDSVPLVANEYPEDYTGSRTPTNNDYMVVDDMSDYTGDRHIGLTINTTDTSTNPAIDVVVPGDTTYHYVNSELSADDWTGIGNTSFYIKRGSDNGVATYELMSGEYPMIIDGTTYDVNDIYFWRASVEYTDKEVAYYIPKSGSWLFVYDGDWAVGGVNNWKIAYKIETAFTQAQMAAINSNITAEMVADYLDPESDVSTAYNKRIDALETDKLDKVSTADKVYGTDNLGRQTTYSIDSFGQVDDVKVNNVSVVTNKVANISMPTAGTGIDITNNVISVTSPTVINTSTQGNETLKIFNKQLTNYANGVYSFNPSFLGSFTGGTRIGKFLKWKDVNTAEWADIPEPEIPEIPDVIPQLSNVQALQFNTPDDYAEGEYKANFSKLEFYTNLKPAEIKKRANEIYVTISRWKRNKRRYIESGGEREFVKNRGKYCVMNDQRIKLDTKMYCWRAVLNDALSTLNPKRYCYFYTTQNYGDDVSQLLADDPDVWTSCGTRTYQSNYATCLNALTFGYAASDFEQYTIWRYKTGDIDTYINDGNASIDDYIAGIYVCKEFYDEASDNHYFLWSFDWEDDNEPVYGLGTVGNVQPNYIADHWEQLTEAGSVADYVGSYDKETFRKDLDFKKFNIYEGSIGDFCETLYNTTVKGYPGTQYSWNTYWFDYPVMPVLLSKCYVQIPRNIQDGEYAAGSYVLLEEIMQDASFDLYFNDNDNIKFILPWDTYYLWLRFLCWQKRCFYEDSNCDWSLKNDMLAALRWDWIFLKRAFGKTRGSYNWRTWRSQVSEYVEFNLATPDDIVRGQTSKSQPIHKRIVIFSLGGEGSGYQGIKD